jgi:hypothetical protein
MKNHFLTCNSLIIGLMLILPLKIHAQTYCNPLNISYRFSIENKATDKITTIREAADPAIVLYKDYYYLFASKSGGYWYSSDLLNWKFVEITTALPIENYAPAAFVYKDSLYYFASSSNTIYRSADPINGKWDVVTKTFQFSITDPAFFVDDDGKVYFYYGCSNTNPAIFGVEVDPNNSFKTIGKSLSFISSNTKKHGWERNGDYNTSKNAPWLEGAWMNKYNGKYYLQYAGPGTENKSYADGVYVSDKPLGPFTYAPNNPFSAKPEGFIGSAGHSATFQDKYGNWWHISTMTISVKHMFERRLGLFPVNFDKDGVLYSYNEFGDYPTRIPNKKIDTLSQLTVGWNLLSYNKKVETSSSLENYPSKLASDENIRTYWSAVTGDKGEWLSIDLNTSCKVNAIQVNFAENNTTKSGRANIPAQQYLVEYSTDNQTWKTLVDKTTNTDDLTHQYSVFDSAITARYLKVTNYQVPNGTFAISDLRVFGSNSIGKPAKIDKINMVRTDKDSCVINLSWNKKQNATGYNIRFGFENDKLYRSYMVYNDTSVAINSLNAGQMYWFAIDAFGESGVTKGDTIGAIVTHDTTVVIPNINTIKECKIYPNPASSDVNIQLPNHKGGAILDIYDVLGVKIQAVQLLQSVTNLSIDNLKKGNYYFVLTFNNKKETHQVAIQ